MTLTKRMFLSDLDLDFTMCKWNFSWKPIWNFLTILNVYLRLQIIYNNITATVPTVHLTVKKASYYTCVERCRWSCAWVIRCTYLKTRFTCAVERIEILWLRLRSYVLNWCVCYDFFSEQQYAYTCIIC